jgi:nanoRNase/pAp phosphatase (c-di-AMP/oligoRNAs hydrolase)
MKSRRLYYGKETVKEMWKNRYYLAEHEQDHEIVDMSRQVTHVRPAFDDLSSLLGLHAIIRLIYNRHSVEIHV